MAWLLGCCLTRDQPLAEKSPATSSSSRSTPATVSRPSGRQGCGEVSHKRLGRGRGSRRAWLHLGLDGVAALAKGVEKVALRLAVETHTDRNPLVPQIEISVQDDPGGEATTAAVVIGPGIRGQQVNCPPSSGARESPSSTGVAGRTSKGSSSSLGRSAGRVLPGQARLSQQLGPSTGRVAGSRRRPRSQARQVVGSSRCCFRRTPFACLRKAYCATRRCSPSASDSQPCEARLHGFARHPAPRSERQASVKVWGMMCST